MTRTESIAISPARRLGLRWRAPGALRAGSAMLANWFAIAILGEAITPYGSIAQNLDVALQPPSWLHPFGTDNFGRDVLSRVMAGTRLDLEMGGLAVLAPICVGSIIGVAAGYAGGLLDAVLMRIVDVTIAFPFFVLMISVVSLLGPGLQSFFIAVSLVGWVSYARLARSRALVLRSAEFVLAARSLGFSTTRILLRHVLPNALVPCIVFTMSDVVLNILLGSSLSYLGLGVQPPTAEWGVMIAEGQNFIQQAWWIDLLPGLAIVLLAFPFSLVADGLAERLGRGG
jgi:peptide/nickel transport system permease protein